MDPIIEGIIHARIDVDLHHKSLLHSGNVGSGEQGSELYYVTTEAVDALWASLMPYVHLRKTDNNNTETLTDLAAKYLERFGGGDKHVENNK